MRLGLAWALALVTVATSACFSPTDPLGRQEALEEAQRKYTDLVRWGDLDRAELFVEPEERPAFQQAARELTNLRITDHEIGEIEYGEDIAFVTVTYKGYAISHLVEHTSLERQEWVRVAGLKNVWHVKPQLAAVVAELHGRPRPPAQE